MKWQGGPNPYYKKINLSNIEYKIFDKQAVYSLQWFYSGHSLSFNYEYFILKKSVVDWA